MPSHTLSLRGESLELLPDRALFWPARGALLVADLHWGKDEAFRRAGLALPTGVLARDLERLEACIRQRPVEAVYVLGDLIHHRDGLSRAVIDQVAQWRSRHRLPFKLIPGNHDRHFPELPASWAVERCPQRLPLGPFELVHDPQDATQGYALAGHIHPVVRFGHARERLTLPCFLFGRRRAILPAFSLFTGGAKIRPGAGERAIAIAGEALVPLPVPESDSTPG